MRGKKVNDLRVYFEHMLEVSKSLRQVPRKWLWRKVKAYYKTFKKYPHSTSEMNNFINPCR
jgi:hypothetical protein